MKFRVFSIILIILIVGCSTEEPEKRVEIGMTTKEVKDVLGEPDDVISINISGVIHIYFHYTDYIIDFVDGIVVGIRLEEQ